jgi:outer membrane protein OmpA-like peptidoglycan-associated protein
MEHEAAPAEPDRNQRLADLLLEVARSIDPNAAMVLPKRLDDDPRLQAVRTVLLREQLELLARLRHTIDDPEQLAATISAVLPHALALSGARDDRLGQVLAPTVERATQVSVRRDPGTLVNILYPVMGPAIRKAIAERLDDTLQGLNQSLRYAFSWRGLKWRIEAWRSGTSFGDVVLKHTVVFRVEHVFLIHRKTSLLLEHVAAADASAQDPQMVSGMLSAIQDFVRDSFDQSGAGESTGIDSLRLGDLLLWCEAGPQAFLALVIRGTPPESLRATLRDTLSDLHRELHAALEDYDGDSTPLGDLAARLEPCLKQQVQPPERKLSPWLWALPLALIMAGGYWLVTRYFENERIAAYVESLRAAPGIVVTGVERSRGTWQISGLRDPLAVNTADLLLRANIDPSMVVERWEPYVALNPTIVLRRLRASLPLLPSVTLSLDGNAIKAQGGAPPDWIDKARALTKALPAGAPRVDLSGLTDVEDPEYVRLRATIEGVRVYFDSGAPNPAAGQDGKLDQVAEDSLAIIAVARRLGFSVHLAIVGHTDSTGKETTNLGLSIARSEVVRSLLRKRGIAPDLLSVRGTGTLEPLAEGAAPVDLSLNRCVTLTVTTSE